MNRRRVAEVNLRGLGIVSPQLEAALEAGEKFAGASGLTIDAADAAIFQALQAFSRPLQYYPNPEHSGRWDC